MRVVSPSSSEIINISYYDEWYIDSESGVIWMREDIAILYKIQKNVKENHLNFQSIFRYIFWLPKAFPQTKLWVSLQLRIFYEW